MSMAYYRRYPRDFIEGTIGMSLEVKGAFSVLLDLIYIRNGHLPDDAKFIAGNLGCSVKKWNAIRSELIECGKIIAESGFITNFRADFELENYAKLSGKNAENAAKPRKNKSLSQPDASNPKPEPYVLDTSVSNTTRARSIAVAKPNGFAKWWETYPNKVGKAAAEKAYDAACRKIGGPDPPRTLIDGLERALASGVWDDGFIPHPTTWLNQGRWEDEPAPRNISRKTHDRPHHDKPTSDREESLRNHLSGAMAAVDRRLATMG